MGIHQRALRGESVSTTTTFRDRTFLSRLEPLTDSTGRITGIIGVALDITERMESEEALRQTNQTLESLIGASPLAIVALDRVDRVTTWNPGAQRIFGWTEREVLGNRLPFVPDEKREQYEASRRADLQGEAKAGAEVRALRKDGTQIDVSLWTAPVKDANDVVIRTIGILADNTDRKRAETLLHENAERLLALSRRLLEVQELERRHVARELHDEIGQYLTGLGFMLDLSDETISEKGRAKLQAAQEVVRELTAKARDLSLRLRPTMLDDLGLVPAILWHIDRFTEQTNVQVTFHHDGLDRRLSPREVETVAFRIVQEALTNVARHSGEKSAVVRLHLDGLRLRIQVQDRGLGFDYESTRGRASSGLSGMRERAVLLSGWLWIDSKPGNGTCVTAELPVQAFEERRRSAFNPLTRG
jgi:PAS domain S-box-containing protein